MPSPPSPPAIVVAAVVVMLTSMSPSETIHVASGGGASPRLSRLTWRSTTDHETAYSRHANQWSTSIAIEKATIASARARRREMAGR